MWEEVKKESILCYNVEWVIRSDSVIKLENVSKEYKNGVHALRNVTLTIEDGEFVYVIGPTGSGKSTPVSYTHLDVYKRQIRNRSWLQRVGSGSCIYESK